MGNTFYGHDFMMTQAYAHRSNFNRHFTILMDFTSVIICLKLILSSTEANLNIISQILTTYTIFYP